MRIKSPKSTALIFNSGKVIITGCKSEKLAHISGRKYAKILERLNFRIQLGKFKIQNCVGSCDVGFPIRLEGIQKANQEDCNYEPELFPGLIWRFNNKNRKKLKKCVALIFVTGKIVFTGGKSEKIIRHAFEELYPYLIKYRKFEKFQF